MSKNYYKMNLTEKQEFVEKMINDLVERENAKKIPIEFSNRMTRTLGYFRQIVRRKRVGNKIQKIKVRPQLFKISNNMLKNATLKSIQNVVIHEVAHYLTDWKFYKNQKTVEGHSPKFRKVCAILGIKNDKAVYRDYQTIKK